jgi:HAD superfamily hydrolase (TIGR01484 family)
MLGHNRAAKCERKEMKTGLVSPEAAQLMPDLLSKSNLARPGLSIPDGDKSSEPLLLYNLLNDFAELAQLLLNELQHESWLNAYLLAAGMNQIMEDYLHPDPYFLGKAAKYLDQMPLPPGPLAAKLACAIKLTIAHINSRRTQIHRLLQWQADLAALVQRLADVVACPMATRFVPAERLLESAEALLTSLDYLPARLRREVLRLPSCFRSFDQQPADLERIVRDFAQKWPERCRPLAVVGIRTSGSYLAPLYGAFLKAQGYQDLRVLTLRPEQGLLKHERTALKAVIRQEGLVLVTDDPPITGNSLIRSVEELEHTGIPADSIVLLLQIFGEPDTLPASLRRYASILLPETEWIISQKLKPTAVRLTLAELLGPAITIRGIEPLPLPPRRWVRSHTCACFRVELFDRGSSRRWQQQVLVKGAGLGYFGEHSLAIAWHLRCFTPEVYGFKEGLLYRSWLPEEHRLSGLESGWENKLAAAIVGYVVTRRQALAVKEDISLRMLGQSPVWEVASNLLSRVFGRGWPLARIPLVDPLVKRLLRVEQPAVIDGNMALSHWFAGDRETGLLHKVDFDERDFCNLDLSCYDPVFDLAGLAADGQNPELTQSLRCTYERLSGETISAERWLLYQWVQLWDRQRQFGVEWGQVRRALSHVLQSYYTELFFSDLPTPDTGPLCVLDLDGVLETESLGFPGLAPAGAFTLRALRQHGYRPVLATGRSLAEVQERCRAYRLAGGVAEYGAVIYNHNTGRLIETLSAEEQADLAQLRQALAELDGIHLDPDFRYAVRAYRLDPTNQRRSLSREQVTLALTQSRAKQHVRPISGEAQTDFMMVRIDKGTGLRVLAEELGMQSQAGGKKPVVLAVGDTISDLPMFELAMLACAPANADARVRKAGVKVMGRPYQSGLALAASQLLGHLPGECPTCRAPALSADAHLLLTLLGLQEQGRWGMAWRIMLLLITTVRDRFE